ncbi:MAG TPA: protein-glutamate O-methyltransferase CheR [Allosphingosinicella sp.]|jgi:chemotaxis protein methyltransferase CheR
MDASPAAIALFARLLAEETGQELATARRWRIGALLEPLAKAESLASVDALASAISSGRTDLRDRAVEALLNNETYFFRDRALFDLLIGPGLARLEAARAAEKRLRIWCAGCSTGQEVWSLAMIFAEQARRWTGWSIEIVGTDVSAAAVAQARSGAYSQFEVQRGLPVTQMMRWFSDGVPKSWRIDPALARTVRFQRHNLLHPAPSPGRFDLLLCRNVLLYFPAERRAEAFRRLASAAAPDGLLMLGAAETVIGQTDAFLPDPALRGLYAPSLAGAPARRAAS